MRRSIISFIRSFSLAWACLAQSGLSYGQTAQRATAEIGGTICDAQQHPIAGATVMLEGAGSAKTIWATTDAGGRFEFRELMAGNYTLHAKQRGYTEAVKGPIALNETDAKSFPLLLQAASTKNATNRLPFSDETNFTVAGVTDTTSLGGHGSDPVRRNSDALSKETAHLSNIGSGAAN